jgi:hypothetical protein
MGTPAPPGTTRARPRRRRRYIVISLVAVIVIWAVAVGAMLVIARSEVNQGIDRLESTQARLTPDAVARGAGRADLEAAGEKFSSAHDLVGSFVVKPFEILPVIGRQVRSVDSLTKAASQVVDIGLEAISKVQAKLKENPKGGPARIALLEQMHVIASRALNRIHQVDLGPSDALVGPIKSARAKFVTRLGDATRALQDADNLAVGLAKLLQGPSQYLVLAANNAEMRNGSGMFLSAGVLTVQEGKLTLGPMQSTNNLNLPPGAVPLPPEFAALWGFTHPTEDWRNLATSPRFEMTAPLGAQMWAKLTGQQVNGVLAIDPVTLAAIIGAEGPINVNGVELNGDNVVQYILHDQYVAYQDTQFDPDQAARRDQLSTIARTAFDSLDQRDWQPSALLKNLSTAVDGRHFLAWSSDPDVQKAWVSAGMAGRLSNDSMLLSLLNFSGNKLDQFMNLDSTMSVQPAKSGSDVTIAVHAKNNSPADQPEYIEGPYPGTGNVAGEYRGQLTFQLPHAASQMAITGASPIDVAGPDGPVQVRAVPIDLKRGEEVTVTMKFHMPSGFTHVEVGSSARVPPVTWHFGDQIWQDTATHPVSW